MINFIIALVLSASLYSQPYNFKILTEEFGNFKVVKQHLTLGIVGDIEFTGIEVYEGNHKGSMRRTIKSLTSCSISTNECRLRYFVMSHKDGKKYVLFSTSETFL